MLSWTNSKGHGQRLFAASIIISVDLTCHADRRVTSKTQRVYMNPMGRYHKLHIHVFYFSDNKRQKFELGINLAEIQYLSLIVLSKM